MHFLGDQHPEPITCLASDGDFIYTAAGKTLRAFKKGKHVSLFLNNHKISVIASTATITMNHMKIHH